MGFGFGLGQGLQHLEVDVQVVVRVGGRDLDGGDEHHHAVEAVEGVGPVLGAAERAQLEQHLARVRAEEDEVAHLQGGMRGRRV